MPSHDQTPDGTPHAARRAATALASLVAIGAGLGAGPAVAAADSTPTTSTSTPTPTTAAPSATTPTSDPSITGTSGPAASGTSTTAGQTTTPSDPTTTTTSTPAATTPAVTAATTPSGTDTTGSATTPAATPTTSTVTTTTTTVTTTADPVLTTPTPGTATTPEGETTTVTGTKTVKTPKGKTRGQHPAKHRSRTVDKVRRRRHRRARHHHQAGPNAPLGRHHRARHVKAKEHKRSGQQGAKPAEIVTTFVPSDLPDGIVPGNGSWGSPVSITPFTQAQLEQYNSLLGSLTLPSRHLIKIYKAAARRFHMPWQLLAAINYVETDYGRDLRLSPVGAEGWMQFMPGTWAHYGMHVDAKFRPTYGVADPWQPRDAIFSAARYLAANGAPRNLPRAVFAYNHAGWYVQEVLSIAAHLDTHHIHVNSKAKRKLTAMRTMARLLNGLPYVWGGGHTGRWGTVQVGYDCSGFVSAVLHAGGYLKVPADTQSLPGDSAIKPGPGRYVTIFDRTDGGALDADHVVVDIGGQYWESGGGGVSGAARVHRIFKMTSGYIRTFNLVLHPRGM